MRAFIDGFSLQAAVRCGADDRRALEQLCRYITRPALANERAQTNAAGRVALKLKTPWRDGTSHLFMSPLEFMSRLVALVDHCGDRGSARDREDPHARGSAGHGTPSGASL